ncbi:MAG TPA: hypothetical protein PLD35_03130 [Caldisericia bacterium]|nr:hypothetical protein [Caldisericia bacterium]
MTVGVVFGDDSGGHSRESGNPGSICCNSVLDTGSKVYSLSFGIKEEERNLDPQSSWG